MRAKKICTNYLLLTHSSRRLLTFHLIYQKVEASEVKRQGISQHNHTCALDYNIALTGDSSPGKTAPHLVYLH